MKILGVDTGAKQYPIYIDNSFSSLADAFEKAGLKGRKMCIVTDSNVAPLYAESVKDLLADVCADISLCVFTAGENSKNLDTISDFYKFFVENHLDRRSVLIALGGGVVGDMCGFGAATYMRGIPFVQIPTTLLSQVDSSVGGKTGVDFMGNKNMVGAFYQPELVYINTDTLNTLPYREVAAGLAESVKHGYIQDTEYLKFFMDNKESIKALDSEAISRVVYGSCKVKSYVVSKDEKESGLREILNFGHTFGHAVESLSGFDMLHGECVAVGMLAALYLSMKRGAVDPKDIDEAKALMEYFELPVNIEGFDTDRIYAQMFNDKKTKNGVINITALRKIGDAYTEKGCTEREIKDAIEFIIK